MSLQIPASASPEVQAAFKDIQSTLDAIRTQNTAMQGRRVTGAGDAQAAQDYTTLADVRALIAAAGSGLSTSVSTPTPSTRPGAPAGVWTLLQGGTNAALVASVGGIVWSDAFQMQMLAGTATARQMLQSGASAAPAWSTTTWPATTTINRLLWSSAANVISDLATANYGVLNTNSSGVPSITASPVISTQLTIGVAGTATGKLVMTGTTAGAVTIQSLASGSSWTLTLPTSAGTSGYLLKTDGAGVTSWLDPATIGGVTSITGTAHQVIASASTGAVTLSAPQDIDTTSTPQFSALGLGGAAGAASTLKIYGSGSGSIVFTVPAAAGANTVTFPAGTTDFSATGGTNKFLKQASAGAAITVTTIASADLSDAANLPLLNASNFFTNNLNIKGDASIINFTNSASTPVLQMGSILGWTGGGSVTNAALGAIASFQIYVNSSVTPSMEISTAGAFRWRAYGAGAITSDASGNLTAVSDERFKSISGAFTVGLNAILQLRPILFQYLESSGLDPVNTYAGFSAQNVLKFIPQAVGLDPQGAYTFNDRPVLAAVVNAIQELEAEVAALRGLLKQPAIDRTIAPILDGSGLIVSATIAPIKSPSLL